MNEAEYLEKHPRMRKSAETALREQIGAVTQGPEVSQAARDAATSEIENHGVRLRSGGCGGQDYGIHVQRAMDAAVAEAERKAAPRMEALGVEIARLAKELADARTAASHTRAEILQPSCCGVAGHFRFQQNGGQCMMCMRERTLCKAAVAEALAECHGQPASSDPAKIGHIGLIAMLRAQRDKARKELAEEREKVGDTGRWFNEKKEQLAAAQSALAEKEKELAHFRACSNARTEERDAALKELSTERAAREKAEKLTQNGELWFALQGAEREVSVLRAQLQQAERERDVYRLDIARLSGANGELGANMEKHWRENNSLRTELAATQETVRRVEMELVRERHFGDIVLTANDAILSERDSLQQQSGALVADVERWKNFNDHPKFVAEIARLKARNAELVKALTDWVEWWEAIAPKQHGPIYEQSVKLVRPDELNQSPE